MNTAQLLNDIEQLPIEAQQKIEEFITAIKNDYLATKNIKLSQEEFVGLWHNRKEMQDGTEWVKNHRKAEWSF